MRIQHPGKRAAEPLAQRLKPVCELILPLFLIQRNHLIKAYAAAVRKGAESGLFPVGLRLVEQQAGQRGVPGEGPAAGHGMPPAEPGFFAARQAGENLEPAQRPVPFFLVALDFPVGRQTDEKLRAIAFVLFQPRGHLHAVGAHPHGDQRGPHAIRGRRDDGDVHVDIGRYQLMKNRGVGTIVFFNEKFQAAELLFGIQHRPAGISAEKSHLQSSFVPVPAPV